MSREQQRVRAARTCYDHLAGEFGVALTDAFVRRGWLSPGLDGLTDEGRAAFTAMGIDIDAIGAARRPMTRSCLDWTERRPHLAGGLGAAVAAHALAHARVLRRTGSRGLTVTADGEEWLARLRSPGSGSMG